MTTETVHQELDSTMETVEYIEGMALEAARQAGFDGESLDKISFAVHETAANAVIHGNRYSEEKKVLVTICLNEAGLVITIADEGDGFDVDALPDPVATQELLKYNGRGIYLSRAFMDEYHVRPRDTGGTEVTLIKYRHS